MSSDFADQVARPEVNLRDAAGPVVLLGGTILAYEALRTLLMTVANSNAVNCLWFDAAACGMAALMAGIRHEEIPALLRILMRGIGAVVLVQVLFDATTLIYGQASLVTGTNGLFFHFGTGLAVLAGFAAIWRPAFLLPLFFHYVAYRHQINLITGVAVSETDYLSMLDVGEFATIGGLIATAVWRADPLRNQDADRLKKAACSLIWACAVGAHLGNYLVSAWTKIRAGGADPLFWLLHNPTQTSILIGLERGDNPLAAWPWLVQAGWSTLSGIGILVNLFVLGSQLAVPLAALHRRLLMALTLTFDMFHIGVYLTLGALFHYWIAVNLLVYLSARRIADRDMTIGMKLTMAGAALAGHFIFYTSHLGWLDGAKLASPAFFAETRDGRQVPVPSVFFGMLSYSIAQTVMYAPAGHFPTRIGGNSYNRTDWEDAQSCGPKLGQQRKQPTTFAAVQAMVRETDAAMREHPWVKADNLYYVYPHHMVANPWMFGPFNGLSMDDIVRYHYVVESVCLDLKDGQLSRDVRHRTDQVIDVGR